MSCLAHYRFKIAVLIVFGLFTQWVLASSQVPTTGLANGTHHEVSVAASSQPTACDDDSAANKTHSHTVPQLHCLRSSPAGAHGSGLQRSGAYDAYVRAARDTARGGA